MAIHGAALGGGLERAIAGYYRIAAPATQIGLPEVNLSLSQNEDGPSA
jgi:3-hydroxyacyl-CoA dehydrogenase